MYHELKMSLLKWHSLAKNKAKGYYEMPIFLTYKETDTTFQSALMMDARKTEVIHLDFKGFYFRKEYLHMNSSEFLEYIKKK